MAKTIVICSDGTGNTSSKRVSNVYHLVTFLALDNPCRQIALYDQGIGTPRKGLREARKLAQAPDAQALRILPGPLPVGPGHWPLRWGGLAFGWGLLRNVRQLYQELGSLYKEGDFIYLFGFSRGAFTVRALAGLIHRCGLPQSSAAKSNKLFREAWRQYKPMEFDDADRARVKAWRDSRGQRLCPIHFLGIWDTVKSYGGLTPILLPHLRHNPIVKTVRHAIALDEKRGWFDVTTWGRLDSDRGKAMTRLKDFERDEIETQDILEVWFRGCHSDIGGGDAEDCTARIALQWMLSEGYLTGRFAKNEKGERCFADPVLAINEKGRSCLAAPVPSKSPMIHESLSRLWCLIDLIPRREIDNSGVSPRRVKQRALHSLRRPGSRLPDGDLSLLRGGTVSLHETVSDPPFGRAATFVRTQCL